MQPHITAATLMKHQPPVIWNVDSAEVQTCSSFSIHLRQAVKNINIPTNIKMSSFGWALANIWLHFGVCVSILLTRGKTETEGWSYILPKTFMKQTGMS